ncbi:hypothetical protein ACFQ1S_25560 [Kibdelosporangium lantanae]|uniref:Uncharacterized protein n=1 Tax=Kibdelosporangium lantanae TaxID=1497396 RepID=A0ABW3MED1_9PSEU
MIPSVETRYNTPAMVRSSHVTPHPHTRGTAASRARNGTTRNVLMVNASTSVLRPANMGFPGRRGGAGEMVVIQYSSHCRCRLSEAVARTTPQLVSPRVRRG